MNSKCCRREEGKGERFICFSPKYTTVNALVSTAGMIAFVFIRDLLIPHSSAAALCSKASSPISALPAAIVLGAPFTLLVAAMSSKCNCCSSCCTPFEFGALLPSSPQVPCVLLVPLDRQGPSFQVPLVPSHRSFYSSQRRKPVASSATPSELGNLS